MHTSTSTVLLSVHVCVLMMIVTTGAALVEASEDEIDFSTQLLQSNLRLQPAIKSKGATFESLFLEDSRTPEAFLSRHQCHDEPAVSHAFNHLDKAGVIITQDFVDDLAHKFGYKFKIQNQTVSVEVLPEGEDAVTCRTWLNCGEKERFKDQVAALLSEVDLPDMEFVVRATDNVVGPLGALYSEGAPGEDLLLPGREFADHSMGEEIAKAVREGRPNCSSVRKGAVFRGQLTGTAFKKTNHSLPLLDYLGRPSPRYAAAMLSKRRPDLLDAGFAVNMSLKNPDPELLEKIKAEGLLKEFLDDNEQRCYEAIVVIDGASLPDRLPRQLAFGIPIIFVRNRVGHGGKRVNEEFWYPEMIEGFHYKSATPETLETVLEEVLALPATTRSEMGDHGRQFVLDKLSNDRIRCYMYKLLSEYAARFHA